MDIKTLEHREHSTTDRTAANIAATLAYQVRRDHAPHRLPAQRDAHPKHHGTVEAELIVDAGVPEDLRHGVFATPGRRYQAWIRFSNAFRVRHDMERDARGIAIKLLGVDGEQATQDFLMVTHSAFFAANATDFLEFPAAVGSTGPKTAGALRAIRFFFRLRPSFRFRLRAFRAFGKTRIRAMSPLAIRYFSQTPYRLGTHEVKFSVRPAVRPSAAQRFRFWMRTLPWRFRPLSFLKSQASGHFLRDELYRALAADDVSFDFLVQRRTDPDRMPLDNATVVWSERRSPYVKVATLRLPKQPLTAAAINERLAFSEHLSFTPWHTLAHEPLGSINQARRIVYETISSLRHDMNGKRRREPLPGESPADYLRSL
jgi:catalase